MNDQPKKALEEYFRSAETWSEDREKSRQRAMRAAWIVAGVLAAVALFEAIALISLAPLKTVVPYTLLVDKQTGYVQALKPLERESIAPDTALTRSFLAQYVIAREGFDIDSLQADYRKVALLSAGEARDRYTSQMQSTNPLSPPAILPKRAVIDVEIHSLVSLGTDTALVRFATVRTDPGASAQEPQLWAAVIKYRYSRAEMSAADRLTNPLGFQVMRYRRTPEIAPSPPAVAPIAPAQSGMLDGRRGPERAPMARSLP